MTIKIVVLLICVVISLTLPHCSSFRCVSDSIPVTRSRFNRNRCTYNNHLLIPRMDKQQYARSDEQVKNGNGSFAFRAIAGSIRHFVNSTSRSQHATVIVLYFIFHMGILSQCHLTVSGISIGYDIILGLLVSFATYQATALGYLSLPTNVPFRRPRTPAGFNLISIAAIFGLFYAAAGTSDLLPAFNDSAVGTIATYLLWILSSLRVLVNIPGFLSTHSGMPSHFRLNDDGDVQLELPRYGRIGSKIKPKPLTKAGSDWYSIDAKDKNLLLWVMAGFTVSVLSFEFFDYIGSLLFSFGNSVDSDDLIKTTIANGVSTRNWTSLLLNALVPCLIGPVWEEFFYRGLIFPFLCQMMPLVAATPISALVFALHHCRVDLLLPLFGLGVVWALLYLASGNLLVSMIIHILWNCRVYFYFTFNM